MHVLISGAGIAGPTLAYFLAKIGVRVTIFETAHALLPYGQNIDVNGSALTIIKKMGLIEDLRRYHTTEAGTQFISPRGKPFAPFPVREGHTISLTAETEILRGDLSKICYEASRRLPNVSYCFSTTIRDVVSNSGDAVRITTSDGSTQEYDLLVAADGQWSNVRKQCFPPESVKVRNMGMYAVYFTIPRVPGDNDWWNIYQALGSRLVTIRPDPHGTIRAMLTFMPLTEGESLKCAKIARSDRLTKNKFLREKFADAGWQTARLLGAMEEADDFYFHRIDQIKMSTWSTGRVTCVGDAAYAPTPLTGAGANLAILGAYVLAGELSKLEPQEHPSKAFAAYESALRPFVEDTQHVPSIFPGAAHPGSAFKRWLFGLSMRTISRVVVPIMTSNVSKGHKIDDEDYKLPHYPLLE